MSNLNTIITYGGGSVLTEIFNALAAGMGESSFKTLLRLMGLFAFLWVVLEAILKVNLLKILYWFGSFYIFINLLLVPKMTVVIVDKLENSTVHTVDNVPIGVGFFASVASQLGYALTTICDELFTLPDDLQYSHTGLVMGARLVNDAMRFQITDPVFSQNMTSYMQQCVFYDLLLGKYTANDLFSTPDIWGFIIQNASPARAFKYVKASSSHIYTCFDGVNILNQDWRREIGQAATIYGQRFFSKRDVNAKSELLSRLPLSLNYMSGVSQDATLIMQQAMTANALEQALLSNSAQVGASAAVGQYAQTRMEQLQVSKFSLIGDTAGYWLSIFKNVIEALLYGSFFIVVLTMVLPVGARVILYYIEAIVWVQLWAPLYAILNLIMTFAAHEKSLSALSSATGTLSSFTLSTYAGLAKVNADIAAVAGFATLLIPVMSAGIVKFTGLAVSALSSQLASISTQAASRSAEEATTGNLSFGNMQYANQSAFNTNANHFNTNSNFQAGMSAYQAPSGALIQHAQDGSTIISGQSAISSTGTNVNFADSIHAQASAQSDLALSRANSQGQVLSKSMTDTFRGMYEFSHSKGHSGSSDNVYGVSHSSQVSNSMSDVTQRIDRFAADHSLSRDEAIRLVGSAYAKANAGMGLPGFGRGELGASVNVSGSAGANDSQAYRDAQDLVRENGFRTNTDTVFRALHDEHYRTGNDEADRVLDSISSSYNQALSSREEMSTSLSSAESYRKVASFAQDNAVSVNTNANQQLVDWMMQQSDGHGGQLGSVGAEKILNGDPMLARQYADTFIASQTNQLASQFQGSGMNPRHIMESYAKESQDLQQTANSAQLNLRQTYRTNVSTHASSSPLAHENVNSDLKEEASTAIDNAHADISSQQAALIAKAHALEVNVKGEISHPDKSLLAQAGSEAKNLIKDTF